MRQGYTPHEQQILDLTRQVGELRLALETATRERDEARKGADPKCYRCDKPYPSRIGFCEECWNAHVAAPPADAATEAVREAAAYIARCAGCGNSDCTAWQECSGFASASREDLVDSCVDDTQRARLILAALSTPAPSPTAKEGRK